MSMHEAESASAPAMNESGLPALEELIESTPANVVATLARAEMDQQASQAVARRRQLGTFRRKAEEIMGDSQDAAAACIYRLPRGGKSLEGPTIRLAEILFYAWENCRVTAKVIEIGRDFITARGQFIDIERNTTTTLEVTARITDRTGRRYNDDMIAMTGNACCAKARRGAILAGIPRPCWEPVYENAKKVAKGDRKTMGDRRANLLARVAEMKIPVARVRATLGVNDLNEMGLDEMFTLNGMLNAIADGQWTVESVFGAPEEADGGAKPRGTRGVREALAGKGSGEGAAKDAPKEPAKAAAPGASGHRETIARTFGRLGVEVEEVPRRLSNLLQRDVASLLELDARDLATVVTLLTEGRTGANGELEQAG